VELLEREAELGMLAGVVDEAVRGSGSLVLAGGEAGIGKSSVVRALRAGLRADTTVLAGGCEPLLEPVPVAPWRELFEAAHAGDFAELGGDDRLVLVRTVLDVLAASAPVVAMIEDVRRGRRGLGQDTQAPLRRAGDRDGEARAAAPAGGLATGSHRQTEPSCAISSTMSVVERIPSGAARA
jgi:hypothetical protein